MSVAQTKIAKELSKTVKKLTGEGGLVIPADMTSELKKADPDTFRRYSKLRREYTGFWRTVLADMTKKQDSVPMSDLLAELARRKVQHHLPTGFTGNVGKDGKWYKDGKLVDGVPSGYLFPAVRMNPNGGPWVFQTVREDGTTGGYFYTREFRNGRRAVKFERVRDLLDKVDSIRAKWLKIIRTGIGFARERVGAVILELLYRFSARVGSEGNGTRHGDKTFGVSTLRGKHCRMTSTGFNLTYLGKDGVKTKHRFVAETPTDWEVVRVVGNLKAECKPSEPLFRYALKSGRLKPVRSYVANNLFQELGAGECTVHKLRTYHATKIAQDLIEKLKTKRKRFASQKDGKAALLKIAEVVGKKLNHVRRTKEGTQTVTGATALANYIDVSLQVEFYNHYRLELPPALTKMTQEN